MAGISVSIDGPQVKNTYIANAGIRKLIYSLTFTVDSPFFIQKSVLCQLYYHFSFLFTKFRLAYEGYAGGVLTVWRDQYEAINGFSNEFWGWGGEDDDLTNRLKSGRGGVARDMSRTRASFYSLSHPLVVANPNRLANNLPNFLFFIAI